MSGNNSDYKSLYFRWLLVIGAHTAVYIGSITAITMAIIHEPWYLSCIFTLFFFSPALSGFFCMFTNLENYYRGRLGWEIIPDDFASFYMRKWRNKGQPIHIMFKE
jgi:hypothetical protein